MKLNIIKLHFNFIQLYIRYLNNFALLLKFLDKY